MLKRIFTSPIFQSRILISNTRSFSVSSCNFLKQIRQQEENNIITIDAINVESERKDYLIQTPNVEQDKLDSAEEEHLDQNCSSCPICRLNLQVPIRHTDVLIISQFVRSDGCVLPRRITGLCKRQQRTMGYLIAMAQKAGLMPNLTPSTSKKDPKKRSGWKKYNKYYDESVIEEFLQGRRKKA